MKKIIHTPALVAGVILLTPLVTTAKKDSKAIRPAEARSAAQSMSQLTRERVEVGRALIEVQSTNWPSIVSYYTDDIEYHDPIVDVEGIQVMTAFLEMLFSNSPDLITTIEDESCVEGMYAATWTMVGRFNGVPYDAKGMSIIKFRPKTAKVYYQRDYYTEGDIMSNIPGLDQAVEGFRTYYKCAVDPTFPCPF